MTTTARRSARPATIFALVLGAIGPTQAADWPAHRHDLARSGVTDEELPVLLHRQWLHESAHAPRPAWPEPGRELNRIAFDYAYEVVAAGGMVYFGSSADHKVYAVDLASGRQRWSFFTGGPVRFAPAIEDGRAFVASDDGCLYCLDASQGTLLWRFQGGPRREKLLGNGQMTSRWPLRSGVAVEAGVVYFSAGMWPSEGVYFYALRADDGAVLWKNDTSGADYLPQPHPPACAVTGVAPQGYLLGWNDQLFLPTGRNVPAAYDRNTGRLLDYPSRPNTWGDRWGGAWNMLADGLLFGWRCHIGPDIDVQLGEYAPDPNDGIAAFDAKTGALKRDCPGILDAVRRGDVLYAAGSGKVAAYDFPAWKRGAKLADCAKWETPHGRVYALILAGRHLVVGAQDAVASIDAETGKVVWEDALEGQARSLAVADGRLLVSTTSGQIACYGAEAVADPPTFSSESSGSPNESDASESAAATARRILDRSGKTAGHCLVLGAGDGRLLRHLATQSALQVHCLEPDAERIASVRRDLDRAGLYGVRVAVDEGSLETVGYPDFFADLIVVPDASRGLAARPADGLVRLLRPLGGTLYVAAPGDGERLTAVREWLASGKVPEDAIQARDGAVLVVRGALPGAADWTHQYADAARTGASADERVRLPLKMLWFGEPGPAPMVSRHWKGPAPLCVAGRMFVIGQHTLIAVDAYNGRELWTRDLPGVGRFPASVTSGNVAADASNVYAAIGPTCLRLDAATGETLDTYSLPSHPADRGGSPVWGLLALHERGILGSAGTEREGRRLFMLDRDGSPRWQHATTGVIGNHAVVLDADRVYLIERTSPAEIDRAKKRGEALSPLGKLVALDAATGRVVWQTEEGIAGHSELRLARGILLATGGDGMSGYAASSGAPLYRRRVSMRRPPVLVGDTIFAEPAAYDLATGQPKLRENPFTGEKTAWNFLRSYGCGTISGAANVLMFRSGTLGIYDLVGDTGIHNLGAIRAGCYVNAIAAGGLLLMPPADAGCTCSYCYQTTVALAPATRQEAWSVFYEQLPNTTVRQAALNLGAPGDQRDRNGTLWLAEPRPQTAGARSDIAVPFRFAGTDGFGPYRRNADDLGIGGTDSPWVYASGLAGPLRAELDLEILDRGFVAWPVDRAPTIDGSHADPCWDGYKAVSLAGQNASATLRYDDENLYVAYRKGAAGDENGAGRWKRRAAGDDAPVWKDDSLAIYLSNLPGNRDTAADRYLHLGVSASGARYDALWTYVTPGLPVRDLPRVEVAIDGDGADWGEQGLAVTSLPGPGGKLRAAADFDPCLRLGWTDAGLAIVAEVKDNIVRPAHDAAQLAKGDSLEVFLAPQRGTPHGYRVTVAPAPDGASTPAPIRFDDDRAPGGEPLEAESAWQKTPEGYRIELLLPWKNLGVAPEAGTEFALQLFVNDDDGKSERFQALWHPAGDPRRDPLAYQTFRLGAEPVSPIEFQRGGSKDRSGLFTAEPPYPYPVELPPLGAEPEDAGYRGAWTHAVDAGDDALFIEAAIPWTTLDEAGIRKDAMMIDLVDRGPLAEPPKRGRRFERLLLVPEATARPRTVSVRLHFAEIGGAEPGQRVFDVKLQGRVVLEDFDVARAAGGANRALVKQFDGVVARGAVALELVPKVPGITPETAPILSGIELLSDGPAE